MSSPAEHPETELPRVSVVVPTRNEERTIEACLHSVIEQDYPHDRFEILVLDGHSDDQTRAIVERVAATSQVPLRLFVNAKRSIPAALNHAMGIATGEFLVRVDGHSLPASDYLRVSVLGNQRYGAVVAGGWVEAFGEGPIGRAVAAALASPFSTGNAVSWRRPAEPREVHSVPCGSYRLSALRAIGGFDEAQLANEDYEANYRLRLAGGRLVLLPDTGFRYVPRNRFTRLARQFGRYGFYKARVMFKHPASTRLRHLIPAAALTASLTAAAISLWWRPAAILLAGALILYLLLLLLAALAASRGRREDLLLLPSVFATMHLSWAAGNLAGLIRWLPARRTFQAGPDDRARCGAGPSSTPPPGGSEHGTGPTFVR